MTLGSQQSDLGKELPIGSRHYRAWVGSAEVYDIMSATQFNLLTSLGLREHHYLLDVGCGSLRAGRLFIPYLLEGRYYGIEPEQWLIEEGIRSHVGEDLVRIKKPTFSNDDDFTLSTFNRTFDFIVAQSIFSHASQAQISRCLSEAKKAMQPSTIFAANFSEGEDNYTGDEWVYPGLVTYTLKHLTDLVEDQGLVCKRIEWPRVNELTWIVIVEPEYEESIPNLANVDATQLSFLENELRVCRERLSKIRNHPYVRVGLKVRRLLSRTRS